VFPAERGLLFEEKGEATGRIWVGLPGDDPSPAWGSLVSVVSSFWATTIRWEGHVPRTCGPCTTDICRADGLSGNAFERKDGWKVERRSLGVCVRRLRFTQTI